MKIKKIIDPIFIVGSSRSGTCLLGELLKRHSQVHCLIEYPEVFKYANFLATQPDYKKNNTKNIEKKIDRMYHKVWLKNFNKCRKCSSACQKVQQLNYYGWLPCYNKHQIKRYADKSHTHLMNVAILLNVFPKAQFLHIHRDVRAVISSMLRYPRLVRRFSTKAKISENSSWPQLWYGVNNIEEYREWQNYSIEKRMAVAWKSRKIIGEQYSSELKEQWLDICYEDLVTKPEEVFPQICDFLTITKENNILKYISSSSLEKWKSDLTTRQLLEIENSIYKI